VIYAWLTHRNSYARRPSHITWAQLRNQFGSNTATDTRQGRAKFRELFTRQLGYVLTVYPAARVDVCAEGLVVYPAPPHVARRALTPGRNRLLSLHEGLESEKLAESLRVSERCFGYGCQPERDEP
jgi:hypothetical protein